MPNGPNVPTPTQLNHRLYERNLADRIDRVLTDNFLIISEVIGYDQGMTTNQRELALGGRFDPSNVSIVNGVGYANDGRTTLYDDDGDGAWDSALTTGVDGHVYEYGPNGWFLFGG